MATPINILVNDQSLLEYFDQVSIQFSEGSFCNSISIGVKDKQLWSLFDPIANFGVLKLQVKMGDMTYKFLTEERSTDVPESGIEFTAWGRSAQALLDTPYSKWINDEEEKIHPWQLRDCTVTEIITYVLNYCCSAEIRSLVSVNWNVENFVVYKDTFSTSHSFPIGIISTLADIIGAQFVANADGSLTVQEYSVAEGTSIQEYNDLDHIVSLSDEIVYPVGYNSVVVNGYGAGGEDQSPYLAVELLEDDLDGWETGKYRPTRCYHYHPLNLEVDADVLKGLIREGYSGIETFSEWVLLIWGAGNTQHPNLEGQSTVTGNVNVSLELRYVTYQCRYTDFDLASLLQEDEEPPYGVAAYYFTDKTNTATLTFDYYDKDGDLGEQPVIQLDWDETETEDEEDAIDGTTGKSTTQVMSYFWRPGLVVNNDIVVRSSGNSSSWGGPSIMLESTKCQKQKVVSKDADTTLKFRIWGPYWDVVERCFDSVYNGITPNLTQAATISKDVEEEIPFSGGEGTLSRPYYSTGEVQWFTPGGGTLVFTKGLTTVKIAGYDETDRKPFAIGKVSYKSNVTYGTAAIPKSYSAEQFYVHLEKKPIRNNDGELQDPEYLSISHAIDNDDLGEDERKDVAISVKDFATDVAIAGASVVVDGVGRGGTDGDGVILIHDLLVGDHTIRITAPGYLDSDEDELANDTFTVS